MNAVSLLKSSRGSVVATRQAHNLEDVGSIPTPAIKWARWSFISPSSKAGDKDVRVPCFYWNHKY